MKWLAFLALASCAHTAPPPPATEVMVTPLPVNVTVKCFSKAALDVVPEAERRVRERFESLGHTVRSDADLTAEVEIASFSGETKEAVFRYCVRLQGRVVRNGQRFSALDTVTERCDDERLSAGGPQDPISAIITTGIVLARARNRESGGPPSVAARLFANALDELTDKLGHQATHTTVTSHNQGG